MPQDLIAWGKTRKNGMLKFVIIHGVLLWGLISAVVFSLIISGILPQIFGGGFKDALSIMLPTSIGLFGIGGVLWGMVLWVINEARWKKYGGKA